MNVKQLEKVDEIREWCEENSLILISEGCSRIVDMNFKCSLCNTTHNISWRNMKKRKDVCYCRNDVKCEKFRQIKHLMEPYNIEPLSFYKSDNSFMLWKCHNCGREFEKSWRYMEKEGYPKCECLVEEHFNKVKELAMVYSFDCEKIENEYKNLWTPLKWTCRLCGKNFICDSNVMNFLNKLVCRCKTISIQFELIKQWCIDNNIELLSKNYTNVVKPLKFSCLSCKKIHEKPWHYMVMDPCKCENNEEN